MAGKPQSGMSNFVHGKNGHPINGQESSRGSVKQNLDDLKVPLPKGPAVQNGHPSRANNQTSKGAVRVKQEVDADHDQAAAKRQSGGQSKFYDTDASSIDRTSTAASVNGHVADEHEGEESSSGVDEEQDDEDDQYEPGEANHFALDHAIRTGAVTMPHGANWPVVKGDSYPSTTSGHPSIAEVPNGGAAQNLNLQRGAASNLQNIPSRNNSQRRFFKSVLDTSLDVQLSASTMQALPNQTELAFASRSNGMTQQYVQRIPAGFPYSNKPPQQQQSAAAPTRAAQQKAVNRTSAPMYASNTAQPTTGPAIGDRRPTSFLEEQQKHGEKQRDRAALQNVSFSAQNRQQHQSANGHPDQHVRSAPPAERLFDPNDPSNLIQDGGHNIQHREPENELDYDVQKIHDMDYFALKKAPFDADPNAEESDTGQQHDAIPQRMAAIQAMQAKAQTESMKAMSINEWEEGGDWFLGQFSNALSQLKDVRQQRRKAAQEYEDEIESRYKAVGQKRRQIDAALTDMKATGGKVLEGTPKKSRRTK